MKLAMLLVVFLISLVSAHAQDTPKPIGPPLAMQVWLLTDQDQCERVTGCSMHASMIILKHEDNMRAREVKIQRDHERDEHHEQWVIEFRETQYLDPPQVGHPRREIRHYFRMVGTRHKAIVTIDALPRKVTARKMGRIFLLSVAERVDRRLDLDRHDATLRDDMLALLNKTRFEDFVRLK